MALGSGTLPEADDVSASANPGGNRAFGDYELLEQIGRGGMGVVYKARQAVLNRLVALKLIGAGEFASPMLIQRFHREAEAAANLHHPNIVPIYETGEIHGQHYLSMALIDGVGLDEHIKRSAPHDGPSDKDARSLLRARQEDVARLLAKVARAVDHAHQHGVLHRDLKPGNIIVDRKGEPHLTDFGVAKVIGRGDSNLTASGAIMGTPSYMAPEQAAGQSKRITIAADVYSLGAILYAMLTGRPPFRGDTQVETLRQVMEQEPKHPSTLREGLDGDLATIAMKCLEKEPQRRYASAGALAEDLERWLRREPILARPVGPLGRTWRWCRREPVLAGLVGGISLCLIAITVVALLAYRNAEAGRQSERKALQLEASARREEQEKRHELAIAQSQLQTVNTQLQSMANFLKQDLLDDLDSFWTNSSNISISITSERLARFMSRSSKQGGMLIPFAAYTHTAPSDMLKRFAPILSYLETNVTELSLRFDFSIYRGYSNAVEALSTGKVGFMRPGPGAYISARQRNQGLRLLVNQLHDGQPIIYGVIFTRSDSDISDLGAVGGKSMGSADEESTFGNYVPKAFLFSLGIRRKDLAAWNYAGSHDNTVRVVIDRINHLGTANANVVAKFIRQGEKLSLLHVMQSVSFPWVASSSLDERVVRAIQSSLLSLTDRSILGTIDADLDGFGEAKPSDYDDFEQNVVVKAKAFDDP